MDGNPILPSDFSRVRKVSFALAGTVDLPSPFPAAGRAFIGIAPQGDPAKPAQDDAKYEARDAARFFLKIVETVNEKLVVTRYIRREDLRAVRLYSGRGTIDDRGQWIVKTADEVVPVVDEAVASLRLAVANAGQAAFEKRLVFDAAVPDQQVVFVVAETAPVLVRVEYEYGATAIEAAAGLESPMKDGCCDKMKPYGYDDKN